MTDIFLTRHSDSVLPLFPQNVNRLDLGKKTVYERKNANSVRANWPVLECICDENNKASLSLSLLPVEKEREFQIKSSKSKQVKTNGESINL